MKYKYNYIIINIMKKIIVLLGLSSLLFTLPSCGDHKAKMDLKKMTIELNRQCPIKYDFATCIGAKIEDGNLVVDYVYDEETIKLDHLKNQSEMTKRHLAESFFNSKEEFGNLLIRAGYGFMANYKGSKTKATISVLLANDEIKQVVEKPATKNEVLDWEVQITNSMLPMTVDEATTLISLDQKEVAVSYIYEVDDEQVNMLTMSAVRDEIKENLKKELGYEMTSSTSTSKEFLTLVCRTNKALRYVYRGKTTGKEIVIGFSNSELRSISHDYIEEE